jgi:hypothetical protein
MTTRLAFATALLAAAAGCGTITQSDPDASPSAPDADPTAPDADPTAPDADPTAPDAAPGEPDAMPDPTSARVTVLTLARDGRPQVGAAVVFADPGNSRVQRLTTGDDGSVVADVQPGAGVTVVWTTATGARLLTVLDVRPGDDLVVGEAGRVTPPSTQRTPELSIVPFDTTSPMTLYTRCSSTGTAVAANRTTATARITAGCDAPGLNDDFILAVRPSGGTTRISRLFDVAQDAERRELSGWSVVADMAVNLTNLPDDIGQLIVSRHLRRGGFPFLYQVGLLSDAPVGATTVNVDLGALVAGSDMLMEVSLKRTSQPTQSQHLRDLRAPNSSYGFDAGQTLLPWFQPGVFDPATRRLEWSLAGSNPFDLLYVDARYTRGTGPTARSFEWRVVAPTSTGSFTLPELPAEVGDVLPRAGDVAWLGEGYLLEAADRTYRDLVGRFDVDQLSWFNDAGPGIGPRAITSRFACGTRACSGI